MRKLCTRQHFIEYLGYNCVEKQALLARCMWQRYVPDLGVDGFLRTYSKNGEVESGKIDVQVKSTDHIGRYKKQDELFFDVSKRDLEAWFNESIPMLLVLYDAQQDLAYYLELGKYFKEGGRSLEKVSKFVRVYIPVKNVLNADAVTSLRKIKNLKL